MVSMFSFVLRVFYGRTEIFGKPFYVTISTFSRQKRREEGLKNSELVSFELPIFGIEATYFGVSTPETSKEVLRCNMLHLEHI